MDDDADALCIFGDPEVQAQLRPDGRFVHSLDEMRWHLELIVERPELTLRRGELAIELFEAGKVIGALFWNQTDSPSKSGLIAVELSWIVVSNQWGKGYGTEAVLFLMKQFMDSVEWPMEVISVCFPHNERAFALAHRLGMRMVGLRMTDTGQRVVVFHQVIFPKALRDVA